jgi:putative monooxygenase
VFEQRAQRISAADVAANRRRGGELRVLLSPATTSARSGFLGLATLEPGEAIREHYHPYSEEYLYAVEGAVEVRCDGEPVPLGAGEALFIPIGMRHRIANHAGRTARLVFALTPLAPRPELGHVDTETDCGTEPAAEPAGGSR